MTTTKKILPKYLRKMLEPLDFFPPSTAKERQDHIDERHQHIEDLLCRNLNMKTVVAFIGAGMSKPLGYPLWGTFVGDIYFLLQLILGDKKLLLDLVTENAWEREANLIGNAQTIFSANDSRCTDIFKSKEYFGTYLQILTKLILDSTDRRQITEKERRELEALHELYDTRKEEFKKYFDYLENLKDSELDTLAIFSEWERLLSSSTDTTLPFSREKWEQDRQSAFFRIIVKAYFKIKRHIASTNNYPKIESEENNPYLGLLKLPIKRFVTFNYDLEMERALLYRNRIPHSRDKKDIYEETITCDEIIDLCGEKSFAQRSDYCKELANFSVARYEGSHHSVFHCHGRVDDLSSCVVSEEDYQKWYMRENDEEFVPFRQTLDLALDSNPILFVGFSLQDADFMRILREISANRSNEKTRNPLFCLLYVEENAINEDAVDKSKPYRWRTKDELEDVCAALYMKYGLNVIPVFEAAYGKENGEPICQKLAEIHSAWRDWWEGILQKPNFRQFERKPTPYYHYKFDLQNSISGFDKGFHEELENVLFHPIDDKKKFLFAPHLAVVVGDGGTGKSWSVQGYLDKHRYTESSEERQIFYWSSYYANDVLTGIDRLIGFFRKKEDIANFPHYTKFDWLKDIVDNESSAIIVFDGIEKLLSPNKENTEGESVSPEVREFFKILSNGNVRSKIVLTTRLLPIDLKLNLEEKLTNADDFESSDYREALSQHCHENETPFSFREYVLGTRSFIQKVQILSAPKCWMESLHSIPSFDVEDDADSNQKFISSICSLFEGHIFGISLMKGVLDELGGLKESDRSGYNREINQLRRDIANTPIDKRIDRMIQEAIGIVDKKYYPRFNRIAREFIQRIALFMHPVRKEIAKVCFDEVKNRDLALSNEIANKRSQSERDLLEKQYLTDLLDILVQNNLVQTASIDDKPSYVVHPLVRSYVFERLHESRFNSFPSLQLPGYTSGKEVVDPGSKLGKNVAINLFRSLCKQAEKNHEKDERVASDMCRGAFSVLRSRFCSNTVARWGNYSEYTKMTLLLYDTAKKVSSKRWDYVEASEDGFALCSEPSGPLYPDELAWVYNEVGLASLSMGNNLNATALWEQGFEISKLIDRDGDGRYLFQSNINLGAIYIYYGRLNIARNYLNTAFEIANKLNNKKLSGRVIGYMALVKYLRGNLEEANADFADSYDDLSGNSRARAVFMNFHGELLLKMNKLDEAYEKIEQSRHISESDYYPDLVAYARLSKANYLSKKCDYIKAQNEFQFVLRYSRDTHLRRLETATLSGMSRLADKLGDSTTAVKLAADSLKISNEYLLSLHQTQGLIVLGKALMSGDNKALGIAYLKTARDFAQRQEYFLRMNEAKEELARHNVV